MSDNSQRDLVLNPTTFAYVLDTTKGNITCWVGPSKTSLSQSDKLVTFNNETKEFEECSYDEAIHLFETVPEGWYVALKNPAPDNKHPTSGTANTIPDNMMLGRKVNIKGPCSFALYPGQMAKIIRGHRLRSNQYLVARVYDAESLPPKEDGTSCVNGEILIIKGTEQPFYIPPTGIEVIPVGNNDRNGYVRDAVTLERLEYCILKDEDGNKRYVKGPEVVFPKPTESFIKSKEGKLGHRAIELTDTSGVYIKVIADYEENGQKYSIGDELFITGKEQKIYYPRPEHTFISYNDKVIHHAIAIPKGEGRYVMNRDTGDIKTVKGPAMYLPDPRHEVIVHRTLTKRQCMLWYPGNDEVLRENGHKEDTITKMNIKDVANYVDQAYSNIVTNDYVGTPTSTSTEAISRGNIFTKPRTISLDSSKYDGAVGLDIWTGYAVNVISKDGTREVICGPKSILLDYDQSLEVLNLSTGKPKTTDRIEDIVFLHYENNKVSDIINVETQDFVKAQIKVCYNVSFEQNSKDKWFAVDNYVKHLCDWGRSSVKKAIKQVNIADFCDNCQQLVIDALSEKESFHKFEGNGMYISDVEVLSMKVENNIQELIDDNQQEIVSNLLQLTSKKQAIEIQREINKIETEKAKLNSELENYTLQLNKAYNIERETAQAELNKLRDDEVKESKQRLAELQEVIDTISERERNREILKNQTDLNYKEQKAKIEAKREELAAANMKTVIEAIGPELATAMNNENNQETVTAIAKAISPYALANEESISTAINKILRGTSLEDMMTTFAKSK